MRQLAVFALVGCLASLGAAHAETSPAPKGPKDKTISGAFTPDRVKSDQEAAAKKLQQFAGARCRVLAITISSGLHVAPRNSRRSADTLCS